MTNTDTDADKYILNGVEVMPNEFIEIVTNFLEAQHSRVIRLNARIAELEAEKCVLIDQQREVKNILIDKNLHIDSLYEEGYKLQQRIAELEGLVDKLIEVGDELADDREYQDDLVDLWHDVIRDWKERER